MSISIVMPCYNEEAVIETVVRSCYRDILSKIDDAEFIVVNDCSTDNTHAILEKLAHDFPDLRVLQTPRNSGHGKALRQGYEAATKEFTFQIDSDNQFDIRDFWKLYEAHTRADVMFGLRTQRQDALHRKILTRIIRVSNFLLFGVWITDANCPFRIMRTHTLHDLLKSIPPDALAPNIMLSILARKRDVTLQEIPVTHIPRKTGRVSIVRWKLIRFCWRGFIQLVRFRKYSSDRAATKW